MTPAIPPGDEAAIAAVCRDALAHWSPKWTEIEPVTRRRSLVAEIPHPDARFVRNQAGIPAVVCGPGEIACAHIVDEWVAIDRLTDATAA